jgi:hypothetical protein
LTSSWLNPLREKSLLKNELTPRSWTNFKGFHEEVSDRVQAQSGIKLFGWGRRSEAAGAPMVCA